MISVSVTVLG